MFNFSFCTLGARLVTWLLVMGLVFGLAANLSARTLFIDLNNAESEIIAIQKGVGAKAEEVVVVPSYARIGRQERLGVVLAQRDVERFTEEAQTCAVMPKRVKACDTVFERIRAAEKRRLFLIRDYSVSDLEEELVQLAERESSSNFDMLVISGHHELGFYRGELAEIDAHQLQEVVKKLPRLFNSVQTVLILGCGTGTEENYASVLSPTFPNASLIVAAQDNAPLRNEPRNVAFVRKIMTSRHQLLNAQSHTQVAAIYEQLKAKNWPVSILWRHQIMFFKQGKQPLRPYASAN